MSEDRRSDEREGRPDQAGEEPARRSVKVTDKRRVRPPGRGQVPERPADAQGPAAGISGTGSEAAPQDELSKAKAEAAEYLEHLQRLKAEFDNYRKRVLREQTRVVESAVEPLLVRLLEVLDEFELALMAVDRTPEVQRFLQGVEMVYAKLADILKAEGLERIEAEGRPFDPALHEALFQSEGEGEPYVEDVLRTGYLHKGKVIRPAGVKVGRR